MMLEIVTVYVCGKKSEHRSGGQIEECAGHYMCMVDELDNE